MPDRGSVALPGWKTRPYLPSDRPALEAFLRTSFDQGDLPGRQWYDVVLSLDAMPGSPEDTIVGTIVKIIAFPLYILTFGLIGFVINGFLLWLTAWITTGFGWGVSVGNFWWVIVAAIVISIINAIFGFILRPQKKRSRA